MPEYRRPRVAGATIFLTIVTHGRRPLFGNDANVARLRTSLAAVRSEMPIEVEAAVVLPDHMHYLWTLPTGDHRLSARVGKMKLLFTKSLRETTRPAASASVSSSRRRHHESDVWQRRFIDHVIRDTIDFERHLDYIHYNPVKHGLATCPHLWPHSSFRNWVERGAYSMDWCCECSGEPTQALAFGDLPGAIGD